MVSRLGEMRRVSMASFSKQDREPGRRAEAEGRMKKAQTVVEGDEE